MTDLEQPIRFLRLNRYGAIGAVNSKLDWGVRATLVERGVAEWVSVAPEPNRRTRETKFSDKGN